jgi:hypothetical protein
MWNVRNQCCAEKLIDHRIELLQLQLVWLQNNWFDRVTEFGSFVSLLFYIISNFTWKLVQEIFNYVTSNVGYKEKNGVISCCETESETQAFEIWQDGDYQRILLTFYYRALTTAGVSVTPLHYVPPCRSYLKLAVTYEEPFLIWPSYEEQRSALK